MLKNTLLGFLAAVALAACADVPQADSATTATSAERGEVVTGSNIPRKRGSLPSGVERIEGDDLRKTPGATTAAPTGAPRQ